MKKLALVLAVVMVLSLGLTACGGSTSSTGTASSAPAGSSSSGSASDAAPAYNPDALQVKALDDNTLQVTLTARTPYFLELTAFPAYAPVQQATVEANGEAWAVDAATYIGNGPYKIAEWVPSSHITMVKNENYWNVDSLAGPDTLQFTLMEDDAAQLTAFQSGELDFIDAVPNDEIDALSSTPEFYKEGQIGTYYVSYNTQAAPFDDPLVRQAFTLAVDRDYICKQIGKSGQIPAGAFVSEGLSDAAEGSSFREVGGDYYDPTAGANEANLTKAKELLALCVDHRGGAVTIEEAVDKLWENRAYDDRVKNLYRKAVMQIRQVLAEHGAEALFSGSRGACQIDVRQMDCDYYEFLQGNRDVLRAWQISGSYLEEYSWAEETGARLENFAEEMQG